MFNVPETQELCNYQVTVGTAENTTISKKIIIIIIQLSSTANYSQSTFYE